MERATKDAWLQGASDLKEAEVEDVPVKGLSVRVRGLSARFAADMQGQVKIVTQGREQIAQVDAAAMELHKFVHGVIEPSFSVDEARQIQERFGPSFKKVIDKIDELSGIDAGSVEETEARFPVGDGSAAGPVVGDGAAVGDSESDVSS